MVHIDLYKYSHQKLAKINVGIEYSFEDRKIFYRFENVDAFLRYHINHCVATTKEPFIKILSIFFSHFICDLSPYMQKVMGIKGRRVHMIEELSETIISFQRGKLKRT